MRGQPHMKIFKSLARHSKKCHQRDVKHVTRGNDRPTLAEPPPNPFAASVSPKEQPETARDQLVPLGERAAGLVLNHQSWIKRRVESIQFLPEGQTRHHISFDLFIPESLTISAPEIGASDDSNMVVVPLTYMRKGALVDLDVTDATGVTLSSVGAEENGRITVAALRWLTEHLPETPSAVDPKLLVDDLEKVVYSKPDHEPESDDTTQRSTLDLDREEYFGDQLSLLTSKHILSATDTKEPQLPQLQTYIDDQISTELSTQPQSENADAGRTPTNRDILASLLLLLSTVSSNYTFAVLLPRQAVKSRTVIKISFDIALPKELQEELYTSAPNLGQYPIYIPTRAASSTHIDLLPADGTEILQIEAQSIGADRDESLSIKAMERRIHLHVDTPDPSPLTKLTLDMWCEPQPLNYVWAGGVLVSLACFSILCIAVSRPDPLPELLTTDNTLTILTLVFALWLSTLLKIGRHRLSQRINRPLSRRITFLVCAVSISLLTFPVFVGRDGKFEGSGIPNMSDFNTWGTFLPIILTAACTLACVCITFRAYCWTHERKSHSNTIEAVLHEGRLLVQTATPSSFRSHQDSGDAAEVAAFECVSKLPEPDAENVLECVRKVCAHIWSSNHAPERQDNDDC